MLATVMEDWMADM